MVTAIARRHGVSRNLVYTWCREIGEVDLPDLVPVVVQAPIGSKGAVPSPPARRGGVGTNVALAAGGSIEIALAGDVRVTLHGQVEAKGWARCSRRCVRHDRSAELIASDGTGLCVFAKRLEQSAFRWPKIEDGVIRLTAAQFAVLVEGLDWRRVHEARQTKTSAMPGQGAAD